MSCFYEQINGDGDEDYNLRSKDEHFSTGKCLSLEMFSPITYRVSWRIWLTCSARFKTAVCKWVSEHFLNGTSAQYRLCSAILLKLVGYFLVSELTSDLQQNLLQTCFEKLNEHNIECVAVVSDGSYVNQSTFSHFGAKFICTDTSILHKSSWAWQACLSHFRCLSHDQIVQCPGNICHLNYLVKE